ncbi:MAG: methyltransferase [Bacteroides sp.]|nr:methyltransferase [Bacteroides sp.]
MAKRKERVFRMKRFEVRHERSANKVGVDGVLIGSWAGEGGAFSNIMDVGCGCGLIALMMAQRFPEASVTGIDIDNDAFLEAECNVSLSPWTERVKVSLLDFDSLMEKLRMGEEGRYDLIVSNPPFFNSGIDSPTTARELARHAAGLSPRRLLEEGRNMLTPTGRLAFIAPYTDMEELIGVGEGSGLALGRCCIVRGRPDMVPKRVMMEWRPQSSPGTGAPVMEELDIETAPGKYDDKYISLCRDFYIIF